MRKYLIVLMIILMVLLSGCGKVDNLITDIDNFAQSDKSQEVIDELLERYNALSDKDKEKISNYTIIEKYKNVDIDKVNAIEEKIANISASITFSELLNIYNEYDKFNANEKALVVIDDVLDRIKLTNEEKAAVAACQYIKKSLKSSDSFKLIESNVIDDTNGETKYYLVNTKFSATNSFGGTKDDSSFQTIDSKFENPWYPLAMLNGNYSTALECTPFLQYYLLSDKEPHSIDCDKILYYIDKELQ